MKKARKYNFFSNSSIPYLTTSTTQAATNCSPLSRLVRYSQDCSGQPLPLKVLLWLDRIRHLWSVSLWKEYPFDHRVFYLAILAPLRMSVKDFRPNSEKPAFEAISSPNWFLLVSGRVYIVLRIDHFCWKFDMYHSLPMPVRACESLWRLHALARAHSENLKPWIVATITDHNLEDWARL